MHSVTKKEERVAAGPSHEARCFCCRPLPVAAVAQQAPLQLAVICVGQEGGPGTAVAAQALHKRGGSIA